MSQESWTQMFMSLAYLIANKSRDPRTKVGAVITAKDNTIISLGYNGFPRGVRHTSFRMVKPYKQFFMVHAEINAILNAIRNGAKLQDATIYCTLFPCVECTKAIIQSGITKIVVPNLETQNMICEMLEESNVEVTEWTGKIITEIKKFKDGEVE